MEGIAYHASHEQFSPSYLLRMAVLAEKYGFDAIHSSDHFYPWSVRQGESGFTFSWIAAALQATSLPFSMVCTPGQRYHPAITAQAIATLCEMFPSRFNAEMGSGEALNENITGDAWPAKDIRNERLLECVKIIRDLLSGQEVTYYGHVKVKEARLYTRPSILPLLYCAAITLKTSEWAGNWADGLVTISGDLRELEKKISVFRKVAGKNKPVVVKHSFSYHPDKQTAIDGAYEQWRTNLLPPEKLAHLDKPEQFDREAKKIRKEDIENLLPVHTTIESLMEEAGNILLLGANCIVLHNVNVNQEQFIEAYGKWKTSS